MPAIRSTRSAEGKFVMIANGAAQDRRLTAAARGIILFVLSLPTDTRFTARWLESQLPDGRESIRSALRNLEECGYLRRTCTAGSKGRWQWDQVISDAPMAAPEPEFPQVAPRDGMPSDAATCDDAPEPEFPQVAPRDGMPSRGKLSDKRLKTGSSKTGKDLKNEDHDHLLAEPDSDEQPANGSHNGPKGPAKDQKTDPRRRAAFADDLGLPGDEPSGDWRDELSLDWPPRIVR